MVSSAQPDVQLITCKSALTGKGQHYRLNPYIGCIHGCAYCYATYLTRWRAPGKPWGTWVQAKTNVAEVLERQLRRKKGIHIFMSTTCDVYQPLEEKLKLTRQCLEVLLKTAKADPLLRITLLTKSDRVVRDTDLLRQFPREVLEVAFTIGTLQDDVAAIIEPCAPRPSRRFAAARELKAAGVRLAMFVSPVLPYVSERELPQLLGEAEDVGFDLVGFDTLNYLQQHVGKRVRETYARLGTAAQKRLERAAHEPDYRAKLDAYIRKVVSEGKYSFRVNYLG